MALQKLCIFIAYICIDICCTSDVIFYLLIDLQKHQKHRRHSSDGSGERRKRSGHKKRHHKKHSKKHSKKHARRRKVRS